MQPTKPFCHKNINNQPIGEFTLSLSHCCCVSFKDLTKTMAASFLWASRVASHLRTSVAQRGFSSGETQSHSFLSVSFLWFLSLLLNLILFFLKVCVFDSKCVFDSDINSPVSGTVVEVNEVLTESPELVSPHLKNHISIYSV